MDIIKVSSEKINVADVLAQIGDPTSGGIACFIGTTRDTFDGKKVLHLEYEAYLSMAEKELHQLCETMKTQWPLTSVVLIHRIGTVPVADASVLVAASAVHRKEALEAISFGIDSIKSSVPIWKKEAYDDGTFSWKENCIKNI